jgi:hypothetical protein
MKVVAIKDAFVSDRMVKLGDEVEIPDDTKGKWFALADSEEAQIAKKIRSFNCTTPTSLNSREATAQHLRNHLHELQRKGTFSSFNEMMNQKPLSFPELVHPQK